EKVKNLIIEKQLIIETNPSSNRIIGHLNNFADHHVIPLTLDENNVLKQEIRVTVGTDNPGVCNTSLAHEFYLLGEVLAQRGVPEPKVMMWLEWLRCNGEQFSFLDRLPLGNDVHMRKILKELVGKSQ